MVSLSNHVAISLRLNARRQTTIATATRLPPPYQVRGRNDRFKWVRVSSGRRHGGKSDRRLGQNCVATIDQETPR